MAYENVDVYSLKNAIVNCKNSINFQREKSIINDISQKNIWSCSAKNTLINAMNDLFNNKISKLDGAYNNFEYMTQKIAEYQEYKKQYDQIVLELKSLPVTKEYMARRRQLMELRNNYMRMMNSAKNEIRITCSNIVSSLN